MPYGRNDVSPLWGLAGGAIVAAAFCLAVWSSINEKRDFMADCEQHKPRFECTALWKASQPDTVTIYTRD